MSLPLPDYYEPARVKELYLDRGAMVSDTARDYRSRHKIAPAGRDTFRIAAFGIDCQVSFCLPGSSLFVPGAVEDMQRAVDWIYRNLNHITGLHFSMDTHRV